MKIGIDIDGTLYPWTVAANELVMDKFDIADPGPHVHWDHLKSLLTEEQFAWIWSAEAAPLLFGRMDIIYANAHTAVNALCADHEVHFVTHRNPHKTGALTAAWLAKYFSGYKGIHILDNSVKKCEVLDWDIFIDDKEETIVEFVCETDAGVFVPVRPWNDEVISRFGNDIEPFSDWILVPGMMVTV